MAKKKNLTIKFFHGESLKTIRKNTEGLFPLYIRVRYGAEVTNFKSISATNYINMHSRTRYKPGLLIMIEKNIEEHKRKDIIYLNSAKRLYEEIYFDEDFNLKFLSNPFIQKLLNQPISQFLGHLILKDVEEILIRKGLEKVQSSILPSVGVFTLVDCMDEISPTVKEEILSNSMTKSIIESEYQLIGVSFLDFYFMKIPESHFLLEIQRAFKKFMKTEIRGENIKALSALFEEQ